MKSNIKEAMKKISLLNDDLDDLIKEEQANSIISYLANEKPEKSNYDFSKTNKEIEKINQEILKIKSAIQNVNVTYKTDYEGKTISDLLILVSLYNTVLNRLSRLANNKQKERYVTNNDAVGFKEAMYDINLVKKEMRRIRKTVSDIQVAIDKANILAIVEY